MFCRNTLNVKPDITIIKCGTVHKFSNNTQDSKMLNLETHGEIFHIHRNCGDIRNDGTCRQTRHTENCYKKRCQDTKRNYREEIKKVLQQNPSSKRNDIIQIVNTNFNLIMDEQGQRQPIGLFSSLGINVENEKYFISRKRKINAEEEIPRDLAFIRHLDENMPNGERHEKFIHKFENMWIMTEPTELRSINGRKWYADGTFFPITGLDYFGWTRYPEMLENLKEHLRTKNMSFTTALHEEKYRLQFLPYMFQFYLTFEHSYGLLNQDHYTALSNGDPDATNNTSESINRVLKTFSTTGKKNVQTVFRSVYNFKMDHNLRRDAREKCPRKRPDDLIRKYERIKEVLEAYDNLPAEIRTLSLLTYLDCLGNL